MGNLRKRVRLVSNSDTSVSVMCTTVSDRNRHYMTLMISCSYAIESIHYSCNYAYKDVEQDITLGGKQSIYIAHTHMTRTTWQFHVIVLHNIT